MMVFRGAFDFLSNFYPARVEVDGICYQNAEAAFQAQKCTDVAERGAFAGLDAVKAKRKGRQVKLRSGRSAAWYLSQLKGQKHLVVGNHDCQQNMR